MPRSQPVHSPAFRIAVPLVLLGGLGLSLWLAVGGSSGRSRGPDPSLSPVEARQQEILEQSIDRPGDPDLIGRYREINAAHFGGRLPPIAVAWEPRLAEVGALAAQAFSLEGMFGHVGARAIILLNPNLQGDEEALTAALCHEMVHAHLYTLGVESTDHGPEFHAELKRLSIAGAFSGLVATPEERASLRAWLDAESRRLDADGAAVRRDLDELARNAAALERDLARLNARIRAGEPVDDRDLETFTARRDAHNQQAASVEARAAAGQRDLAEFNRQVARYNRMLAYPDGLDEPAYARSR